MINTSYNNSKEFLLNIYIYFKKIAAKKVILCQIDGKIYENNAECRI